MKKHLIIIGLIGLLAFVLSFDLVNRYVEAEECFNERIHYPIRGANRNAAAWEECKALHLYFPFQYFTR